MDGITAGKTIHLYLTADARKRALLEHFLTGVEGSLGEDTFIIHPTEAAARAAVEGEKGGCISFPTKTITGTFTSLPPMSAVVACCNEERP